MERRFFKTVLIECKGDIPEEIQILPYGFIETSKGSFLVDEEAEREIIKAFKNQKNDMVIDYEHQTLTGQQAPAAGWIKELINRGKDGIWAKVEWTNKAKEYLKNKEYKYLSPVFLRREKDKRVVKLINAALTNQPAIDGMVPIVNKYFREEQMDEILKLLGAEKEDEAILKLKEILKTNEELVSFKNEIKGMFSLKEDAENSVVFEKLKSSLEDSKLVEEICKELDIQTKDVSEIKASILAMKQGYSAENKMAEKLAALEQKLKRKEAEELVEQAMKEGKILPAQREWALKYAESDAEGFRLFVQKSPVVVDFSSRAGDTKADNGIDEATVLIAKQLGVDVEAIKKLTKEE